MRVAKRLLFAAFVVSPLFAIPIGLLLLDWMGVIELPPQLSCWGTCYRPMLANLVLYWLLAAALVACIVHRRAVSAFVARHKGRIAACVVATVVALLGAELALRVFGHPSALPEFRWLPSPHFHHVNEVTAGAWSRGIVIRTNADGFRTSYTREEFLEHPVRIAVLGDSFVFGVGVREQDIMTSVLQRTLREAVGSDDVAVLNTGVNSYSPILERSVFREVVSQYRPTLTLLFLDANDIGDDYKYERESVSGDPENPRFDRPDVPPPLDSALLRLSEPIVSVLEQPFAVLGYLRGVPAAKNEYYDFRVNIDGVEETDRWFILRHPLALTRAYFERTFRYVSEIARDARDLGSKFVLVVPPRYFQWSDREAPHDWAAQYHGRDEPYEFAMFEFFDSVAASAGFPVLSLLPAFQATKEFPLVFDTDTHWNAAGNRFVAKVVAQYLLAQKLVVPH